jgi:hypothetical protein
MDSFSAFSACSADAFVFPPWRRVILYRGYRVPNVECRANSEQGCTLPSSVFAV